MPSDPHERIDLPALMSVASLLPVGPIHRVIVCGSREWEDTLPIAHVIGVLGLHNQFVRITTGGARGADTIAHQIAGKAGLLRDVVRADWDRLGRGAGFERNARMLALSPSPNLVLAFKDSFDYTMRRGGTEHMCRIALATDPPTPVLLYSTARGWERLERPQRSQHPRTQREDEKGESA